MKMSVVYTCFLVLGLLVSGVSIPLLLSFQDHQDIDGEGHYFTQPLLQTVMIFLGEIICIFGIQIVSKASSWLDRSLLHAAPLGSQQHQEDGNAFAVQRSLQCWSTLWFIIPSACDLISTTMLNLGLIYCTPSVFQMIRSGIVGFSAVFSFIFLSRRFLGHEWIAVVTILGGIGIIIYYATGLLRVGAEAHDDDGWNWMGPLLLLSSQVFVACQFIMEEYLMDRFQMDPVRAMGFEGIFGTLLLGIAVVVATFAGSGSVFDLQAGVSQLIHSSDLWQSALVLALMVAVFNFFGLAVSTSVGIPGRSILDAIRTTLIWVIAAHYGLDSFSWLQLVGFVVLAIGVFIFNGVFSAIYKAIRQTFSKHDVDDERAPLLA